MGRLKDKDLKRAGSLMASYTSLPTDERRALLLGCAAWELDESGQNVLRLVIGDKKRKRLTASVVLQVSRGRAAQRVLRTRTCLSCGCTDDRACYGGCTWDLEPGDDGLGVCARCKP